MNQEKTVEEVFFETCVLRMKKLPSKSFMQLQISQLFVNAENPPLSLRHAMLTKEGTGIQEDYRSSCGHNMWSAVLALYEKQCAINKD